MSQKKLRSGLVLKGINPNTLLSQVENTSPFLFSSSFEYDELKAPYIKILRLYKNHPNLLKNLNLFQYFELCLAAHWATAGSLVPTDVDNQIREGLWRHEWIGKYIEQMARLVLASYSWDYSYVTRRMVVHRDAKLSTHEGTWLSVAIGSLIALRKNKFMDLALEVEALISFHILKEERLLKESRERRDEICFMKTAALMAHNLGDLSRVIDQWELQADDELRKKFYKLGHEPNSNYPSSLFIFAGEMNKALLAIENHRHMSMRAPKGLRKSAEFFVPVGPFFDQWGKMIAESKQLTQEEKGEILVAFLEGFKRQNKALGYVRAIKGLMDHLPGGISSLDRYLPFNVMMELKEKPLGQLLLISKEEFEQIYREKCQNFTCSKSGLRF